MLTEPYSEMYHLCLRDPCIKECTRLGCVFSDTMEMLSQSVLVRADIGGIPYHFSMKFHRKDGNKVASNCNLLF